MSDDPDGSSPPVDLPRLPSLRLPSPVPVIDEPQLPSAAAATAVPASAAPAFHQRDAANVAKKAMRKRRRRNKLVGRVAGIAVLATLGGVGYAAYKAFEKDQDESGAGSNSLDVDAAGATPLGQQAEAIEVAEQLNSDAAPSAGALVDAVNDARDVVGQTNGETPATPTVLTSPVEISSILPSDIELIARRLEPVDGFTRYLIDADLAMNAQRQSAADWFSFLRSLPQSLTVSNATVVPSLESGQMLIAYKSVDGVTVDRLVVTAPDDDITIDAIAS